MDFIKPKKLKKGDTVAILSSSWGGPNLFPHIYESGIKVLEEMGLTIKEYPTTRAEAEILYNNPKARANDINQAFNDPEVNAIIQSIGGDDSIRILQHLDKEIITNNPKILMGYSDTTTLLAYLNQWGLVTLHGPSIMAGFSQLNNFPEALSDIHNFLFSTNSMYQYKAYRYYCEGYPDWSKLENTGKTNSLHANTKGWGWLQGEDTIHGHLFGGNMLVMQFLKSTQYWPHPEFWNNKILFFETSEEMPSPYYVKLILRNYGIQGIFDRISGLIFGRPRDFSEQQREEFNNAILEIVKNEFNNSNLPIVTNLDFGHTDPQLILPLGITAEINCQDKTIQLLEPTFE
ncbi:MAG: S66 family peptidase [Candidatus Kariarchaeaceae archaeon]|jgi:muramoyltetrapeptide carboxypeptidase LdcA involved in peptidoglycan recycling